MSRKENFNPTPSEKLKLNQNESSMFENIEKVYESDINTLEESGMDSSVNELARELIHKNDNLSDASSENDAVDSNHVDEDAVGESEESDFEQNPCLLLLDNILKERIDVQPPSENWTIRIK